MIRKKGMPITGTNTAMRSKPPVKTDAAHTSTDAEKQVKEPPQPFANPQGAQQTAAGTGVKGAVPGPVAKPYAGRQHSNPGARALPDGGAVGYKTLPNQSAQIGGRMGFPPPKRKAGTNLSRFPQKRNARFYGE